jgi:hypothetical protein
MSAALKVTSTCLVFFVDETGHERLVPGHTVYGLGGCAAMGNQLEVLLREPWREVRRRILGDLNLPLHASTFGQHATRGDIQVVADFFRSFPFARIGGNSLHRDHVARSNESHDDDCRGP